MKRRLIRIYIVLTLIALLALTTSMTVQATEEQTCEHTFGEWVLTVVPDCTHQGEATRTCTQCGQSETIAVSRPGHIPSDWILEQDPQADQAGSMYRACTVCGEILQTEAISPLPTPDTEAEPDPEPEPDTEAEAESKPGWVEIPLSIVLIVGIFPNVIWILVLIIKAIVRRLRNG